MLGKTTFGGVCIVADRAFEGSLPLMLPLVRDQPRLALEHPPAEAALVSRCFVVVLDVGSQKS